MIVDAVLDAVISAFIGNPELSSIKYDAGQNIIVMEMILTDNIDYNKQQLFCRKTTAAIKLLHRLKGEKEIDLRIHFDNQGNISILTLCRDAFSLSEEEIDLYVRLAGLEFPNVLLREIDSAPQKNTFNDLKKRLLQNISHEKDKSTNIFAYRDRGKMFVFDK